MRIIEVVAYRQEWPGIFWKEAEDLKKVFGQNLSDIQHIGSTSVPGLKAKPTIDILVSVKSLDSVDEILSEMREIGYEALGEFGIAGRRFFVKKSYINSEDWTNSFHVHVFREDDRENIERHVAVRDYLRANQKIAEAYGSLKERAMSESGGNADRYVSLKEDYVRGLEKAATDWYLSSASGKNR